MASWKQTAELFGQKYDPAAERFYEKFYDGDYYGVDLTDRTLGLGRLFVLATGSTASASEALVNGLRGIGFEVTLIGERTNGKNVGMNVFEWRDLEGYDYEFAPITFQGIQCRNADGGPRRHRTRLRGKRNGERMVRGFRSRGTAPAQGARTDRGGRSRTRPDTLRRSRRSRAERPVRNASVHPSGMIGPRGIVPEETGAENGEEGRVRQKTALTAQKFGE